MADFFKSLEVPTTTSTGGSPKIRLLLIIIAVILVTAFLVYWFVFRKKPRYSEVKGPFVLGPMDMPGRPKNATKWSPLLPADELANLLSNNFTCSFFVYMDDANRERIPIGSNGYQYQYLMTIGNSYGVMMDPIAQKMIVTVIPQPINGIRTDWVNIEVENVMLAKWNQVTFTIEGRTIDIYLNGKLVKSKLMENVPVSQLGSLVLNNSPDFTGQAGLFQVWPMRRTTTQILENYKRNTDPRGKPLIPDVGPNLTLRDALRRLKEQICSTTGFCGISLIVQDLGPLHYVEYEFA